MRERDRLESTFFIGMLSVRCVILGKAKNEKEKNRGGEEDVDDSDSLAALEAHYVGKAR